MKAITPEQLDLALQKLKKTGSSPAAAVIDFDIEQREELSSLLEISNQGLTLANTVSVPSPSKRKLYINSATSKNSKIEFGKLFRLLAAPAFGMAAFLFIIGGIAQAAANSLPGDSLYPIKRASERLRVAIATDQDTKAELELAYTKKRLAEAKQILQSETKTADQELAAITELKNQSQKAFAAVPEIATNKIKNNNDDSLIKDLIAINNQQKSLLDTATEQTKSKQETHTALALTEQHEKTIAKILATVNNQTLADLDQKTNLSGSIEKVDNKDGKLLLNKQEVYYSNDTIVFIGDKTSSINQLSTKFNARIIAANKDGKLIAQKIELMVRDNETAGIEKKPEVKGTSITSKEQLNTKPTAPEPEQEITSAPPVPEKDPNQAYTGFIPETNSEQYKP